MEEGEEYPFSVYERALQLWKMATQLFLTSPTLSQSYIRQLIAICTANNFPPSNSFYQHVCSICGILWYPDISMTMRIWRYSKIRAVMRGEGKKRRKYRLMSTILMPNDTAPKLKGREKEKAMCPVYECLCCGYRSIFDIYPVTRKRPTEATMNITIKQESTTSPIPVTIPCTNKEDNRKIAQLQRILQRSANKSSPSTSNTPNTKSGSSNNGLSGFLSGLGPALFKK